MIAEQAFSNIDINFVDRRLQRGRRNCCMGKFIMDNKDPKEIDHVVFSSAWVGNLFIVILVVLVFVGFWAYREYF